MSEVKFTKGPWFAGHLGSDSKCQCRGILSEGYMGCIATIEVDNGKAVSNGGNDAPPLDEAIANMRLITAAPELYEALENLVNDTHPEYIPTRLWIAARNALSKARGEHK